MIVYLCNGKDPKCRTSANCYVNNPEEGLCRHTTSHLYSKNDPDVSADALRDPDKWERKDGSTPQYWEKELKDE